MSDHIDITPHERATVISADADALVLDARWTPEAELPINHMHPRQDEHFEVLEGALAVTRDGQEWVYAAGEKFTVPRGTAHRMGPAGDAPARARWEIRPALRTEEMFRAIEAAGRRGGGRPGKLDMVRLLGEHRDEFRLGDVPGPLQTVLVAVLSRVARLRRTPTPSAPGTA